MEADAADIGHKVVRGAQSSGQGGGYGTSE